MADAAAEDRIGIIENYLAEFGVIKARHNQALAQLKNAQRQDIRNTGIDPDEPARQRARIEHNRRIELVRNRQIANNMLPLEPRAPHLPVVPQRQLAQFAYDSQNVHTSEAVRQTKDIVARVREIPVPEDYRWNTLIVSKTIGEIITDCRLTDHAAAQMFNQYVSTTAVYDIEEGIYGKVLDSVWQYVKASSDKEDLCKILKNEMQDNVGMCAQGNLSRICNILAGYIDGIGSQESLSERLGRLLPSLMEIEDIAERIRQACVILSENKVPYTEWNTWMDPILEDEYREFYEMIREQLMPV